MLFRNINWYHMYFKELKMSISCSTLITRNYTVMKELKIVRNTPVDACIKKKRNTCVHDF